MQSRLTDDFYFSEYLPKVIDMDYWFKYVALVRKCLSRGKPKGYYEKHHIVPKSYLPNTMTLEETFYQNKVNLTAQEHYKAHYYLSKALGGKMVTAYEGMSGIARYGKHCVDEEDSYDKPKDPYRYTYSKYKRYIKRR